MRQFHNASEIEPMLVGFVVAEIANINESNDLSFTYMNSKGVAVQLLFTEHGNFFSEPYATGDNMPDVENRESVDRGELIDIAIRITLDKIGFPHNLKGYLYIISATKKCVEDRSYIKNIVKVLYHEIAEENGDTISRTERAIRHAIEVSFSRGNIGVINNIFGYAISPLKGKLSNAEFIAYLTDFINLHYEEIADGTYQF